MKKCFLTENGPKAVGPYSTAVVAGDTVYLSGMIRTVCEVALEFLPTGQALLLSDVAIEYPVRAIALSVVFTVVTLLVGSMLFRRKDIK